MASPGKVLIIVQNLPVPFDRRVWLEATTLEKAGYQVSVICPTGKHGKYQVQQEVLEGIHIFRYAAPPEAKNTLGYFYEFAYSWLATAWLSLRVWRKRGFDVLHACNPPETYFLLAAIYQFFGKRFLFDHHDLSPEMYLAKGGKREGALYKGLLWLERLTFHTADTVITTNQSHKDIAMERGGVPESRIFIVRSGPDMQRLKSLPPEQGLKDGFRHLACYLGEMCPQDGVDYLLRAIDVIVHGRGHIETKFVLIGGGPSLGELREMNQELGLSPYVEFTGRVSDHDLSRYLSTADLCLDPDPYSEWSDRSTMNKIIEYMAFGKPIVAFDLKEHRVSAGDAAIYAPANDTEKFADLIMDLLSNEGLRKKMGAVGEKRVRCELAWEFSIPNLLAAYEQILSTR